MYCRNCGTKQDDNASFCNHCGAPLNQPATQEKDIPDKAPKVEPKKKLSKKIWIIIIVSIVVVAVLGTVVGVIVHHNNNTKVPEVTEVSDESNEPITGQDIVNAEELQIYRVEKIGNDYFLFDDEGPLSDWDGAAPVVIEDFDSRRNLYMFKDGKFDSTYNKTYDLEELGRYYYENGMADVYDYSDILIQDSDGTVSYYKFHQWQKNYSGLVVEDDTGREYEVKDGIVINP